MRSSLHSAMLAVTAAAAIALGGVAAHADDFEDLLAAQQTAALLDAAVGADDVVSEAVEAAAAEAATETLLDAAGELLGE